MHQDKFPCCDHIMFWIYFFNKNNTTYNTVNKKKGIVSNNWKGNISIDYIVCLL